MVEESIINEKHIYLLFKWVKKEKEPDLQLNASEIISRLAYPSKATTKRKI